MSGDQLRYDATYGHHEHLRDILKTRPNTASADEFGLTPLMYAVWNNHVECVKYLVSNDVGVDKVGHRVSSLFMRSCRGYTALHMAAAETYEDVAEEITMLCLIVGMDQNAKDEDGYTPQELAVKERNVAALEAFKKFSEKDDDEKIFDRLMKTKQMLLDKYTFIHNPTMNVEKWNANFIVPDFVFDESKRYGELPEGMTIHEQHIGPLVDEGYYSKGGVDALHCIEFAKDQAELNLRRREDLLMTRVEDDWEPVDRVAIKESQKRKKGRGPRRQNTEEEDKQQPHEEAK